MRAACAFARVWPLWCAFGVSLAYRAAADEDESQPEDWELVVFVASSVVDGPEPMHRRLAVADAGLEHHRDEDGRRWPHGATTRAHASTRARAPTGVRLWLLRDRVRPVGLALDDVA